jgi:hypothetical protein
MSQIYKKSKTERENGILPFLKLEIKNPFMSMELKIKKSKNIINNETYKLIDSFNIFKLERNPQIKLVQTRRLSTKLDKIKIVKMNNNIAISENNSFFKEKLKDMKSLDNKTKKYKQIKIKNFKLSSKRERYISLLKKYNLNDIKLKTKIIDDSKTNNNTLSTKPNKSTSNVVTENQIKDSKSTTQRLKPKKIKILKKDFNKSFSKFLSIEKALNDTKKDTLHIIQRIKRYKVISDRETQNLSDAFQKKEESIKKVDNLINEENDNKNRITDIDYNKLLGPLNKTNSQMFQKIKINQKQNGQIWLKQSTANMIKFGQYFNRMDDEQFFKQRKKIIKKFAAIEKDSDIIDGIKTERCRYNYGKGIKKNNKIITKLAEDNLDFFRNVSKKFNNS